MASKWAILRAAGVEDDKARDVLVRAERIEEAYRPDGAREYVPVTSDYAAYVAAGVRPGGPKALRDFGE